MGDDQDAVDRLIARRTGSSTRPSTVVPPTRGYCLGIAGSGAANRGPRRRIRAAMRGVVATLVHSIRLHVRGDRGIAAGASKRRHSLRNAFTRTCQVPTGLGLLLGIMTMQQSPPPPIPPLPTPTGASATGRDRRGRGPPRPPPLGLAAPCRAVTARPTCGGNRGRLRRGASSSPRWSASGEFAEGCEWDAR